MYPTKMVEDVIIWILNYLLPDTYWAIKMVTEIATKCLATLIRVHLPLIIAQSVVLNIIGSILSWIPFEDWCLVDLSVIDVY